MSKGKDPLWAIVGEDVRLQGRQDVVAATCPNCGVNLEIPKSAMTGDRVRCGVCGGSGALRDEGLVPDDGSAKVGQRLAQ